MDEVAGRPKRGLIAWWHGSLNWPAFWASVMGATRVNCMIMLILAGASFMSTSMAYTGMPLALASWVDSLHLSPYALIAALNEARGDPGPRMVYADWLEERGDPRAGLLPVTA